MSDIPLSSIEKLTPQHDVTQFRCKKRTMQKWLQRYALKNQPGSSQTYVVHREGRVVGYYSLTYGEVQHEQCPPRVSEGMPEHYAVPVIVLARLAVDDREARQGLGKALLKHALTRAAEAAQIAGLKAVLVHALDEDARGFYKHFGFEDTPVGPLQLMLLVSDIQANALEH
ncbi:MAG: GNAT family N-acetyltransferase [Acidobacteriia bacterium]|nr:GNAT family N-acetyltransferase [Terriglobia bacterium]